MTDSPTDTQPPPLPPEDKERVARLVAEIMEPAIRTAATKAKDIAPPMEILSALANAYADFMVQMLGYKAAAGFMRGHADHIVSREETGISDEKH